MQYVLFFPIPIPILLVEQGLGSMHNMTIANERLFSKYHNIKGQGDRVKIQIQNQNSKSNFSLFFTSHLV